MYCFDIVLTDIDREKYVVEYNQAIIGSGFSLLESDEKKHVEKAAFRFQQVVEFADRKHPKLRLPIEKAYLGLARAFALLGDKQQALKSRAEYLRKYRRGVFRKEITKLPPRKF